MLNESADALFTKISLKVSETANQPVEKQDYAFLLGYEGRKTNVVRKSIQSSCCKTVVCRKHGFIFACDQRAGNGRTGAADKRSYP